MKKITLCKLCKSSQSRKLILGWFQASIKISALDMMSGRQKLVIQSLNCLHVLGKGNMDATHGQDCGGVMGYIVLTPAVYVLPACTHVHTNVPVFASYRRGSEHFGQLSTVTEVLGRLE